MRDPQGNCADVEAGNCGPPDDGSRDELGLEAYKSVQGVAQRTGRLPYSPQLETEIPKEIIAAYATVGDLTGVSGVIGAAQAAMNGDLSGVAVGAAEVVAGKLKVVKRVFGAVSGRGKPVEAYEVGRHNDLKGRSVAGDGLDIHHAGQSHPMKDLVQGYDHETGPAIAVPFGEHRTIPTVRGPVSGTARSQLAKDIIDLRNRTNAPNSSLQELIELNKSMFPEVRK